MLRDKKFIVARMAANARLRREIVQQYGAFLRTLFDIGDWFVTLTFRDKHQDSVRVAREQSENKSTNRRRGGKRKWRKRATKCPPDPRLETWEPDSRNRRDPGPPVRDAALREIEHWLLELGWEASGHTRQEIFDPLANGLYGRERRDFAKRISKGCLICAVMEDPVTFAFYFDLRKAATTAIGWVIAEEFGRAGGRWHVHLLIRGVQNLKRKKWWRRAFVRFGRSRIEAIHE